MVFDLVSSAGSESTTSQPVAERYYTEPSLVLQRGYSVPQAMSHKCQKIRYSPIEYEVVGSTCIITYDGSEIGFRHGGITQAGGSNGKRGKGGIITLTNNQASPGKKLRGTQEVLERGSTGPRGTEWAAGSV